MRQAENRFFEEVRLPGRPELTLFHPLYKVLEHFFDVGADVLEFHPNAETGCVSNLPPEFKWFVKAFQSKGHYNFVAYKQRSMGFDKQSLGAYIFYVIGIDPIVGGEIDWDVAGSADSDSIIFD